MPIPPFPACDRQLGHWRLSKQVIGSGTTSTVVLATHVKLPTLRAAVKVISRRGLLLKADGDPSAVHLADAVVHREVLLMKLAAHERIVRLFDFVGNGDNVYIIMEYAPRQTLFDLFRTCSSYLPPPLVIRIFLQVMQGLASMHALHIVHRDLKLENVFVFGPDVGTILGDASDLSPVNVKIGDFGLAHVDDPCKLSTVFHGSPHYQAPELWARIPHHALPTDIWSAGVILYALHCRRLPFELAALETCATVFPSRPEQDCAASLPASFRGANKYMAYDVPEVLPPAADTLLRRLFAVDPSARPAAHEVLYDALLAGLPLPAEEPDTEERPVDPRAPLHDLATLCVPPGRHVPHATFPGSNLARVVQARLVSRDGGDTVKRWARRLGAYAADRDAWDAAVDARAMEGRKAQARARSLGRSAEGPGLLMPPRPRFAASLSLRSLRLKAELSPRPAPASSSVAALQNRREALLRRAYELGFGTGDLRSFADETGRIVRVACEGHDRMGLQEIAQEVERRSSERAVRSACASAATTLVAENIRSKLLSVPVAKLVALEV